jgi:hypothetical protein
MRKLNSREYINEIMCEVKIVGVSFNNRQEILRQICSIPYEEQMITIEPEPENAFDEDAIVVKCQYGTIGYIPRELTNKVRNLTYRRHYYIGIDILGIRIVFE